MRPQEKDSVPSKRQLVRLGSFSLWKTAVGAEGKRQAFVPRKGGKIRS